jgi:hypothetical protein
MTVLNFRPPEGIARLQDPREQPIQLGIAVEGKLEGGRVVEPHHLQKEAALHLGNQVLVPGEPGHAADRLGKDEVSVGVAPPGALQDPPHRVQPHRHAGHVVVDLRGMVQV